MISVCMATYNGERYIKQQIASILPQLGPNDELIISDDGSTDGTLGIIRELQMRHSAIALYTGPGCGVIKNFENALRRAQGDYIYLSDQDDVWLEDKVARVQRELQKPGVDLVVHNGMLVDSKLDELGISLFELRDSRPGLLKNLIKNSFVGCCMAFTAELKDRSLPFPENIEMHDWWIGLVSEVSKSSVFLTDCLIKYRRHDVNVSSLNHHPLNRMVANRIVFTRALLGRRFNER